MMRSEGPIKSLNMDHQVRYAEVRTRGEEENDKRSGLRFPGSLVSMQVQEFRPYLVFQVVKTLTNQRTSGVANSPVNPESKTARAGFLVLCRDDVLE